MPHAEEAPDPEKKQNGTEEAFGAVAVTTGAIERENAQEEYDFICARYAALTNKNQRKRASLRGAAHGNVMHLPAMKSHRKRHWKRLKQQLG